MTVIECTHADCRKSYRVSPEIVGREVKCKQCGRTFLAATVNLDSSIEQSAKSTLRKPDKPQPTPSASSHSKTPQRIGRFEVRKKLGHGAFGNVYRAYDPQLEREVAIKVPQAGLLATPEFVQRFLREAKAAARLNHPNIVPVYDAGQDGDQSYIASKFIDGQPLSDLVDDFSNDYRRIAEVVRQIAEALQYAHTKKIVHRDIKPHNVMLDADDEPHLMDFGLAHLGTEAQKLTHDGTLMGTPAYMSPEQAAGKTDAVTAASDQYSLGVVLFELLTGETPFAGSPSVVIYNILNRPLPQPRTLNKKIPRDLETICLKAVSKEPSARYKNCGAFAADLDRWLHDRPITARRVSLAEQTLRWCQRNPVVAVLSVAVLAAILIGGATATMFGLIAQQRAADLGNALSDVSTEKSRADEKAEEAKKALDQLEPEKKRAEEKAAEAERERETATKAATLARSEAALAQRRKENQEMMMVQQDWENGRFNEMRRRLNEFLSPGERLHQDSPTAKVKISEPQSGKYRGFEWHYWNRRLEKRQRRLYRVPAENVWGALIHPDGKQILCWTENLQDNKPRLELFRRDLRIATVDLDAAFTDKLRTKQQGFRDRFQITADGQFLLGLESLAESASPELTVRKFADLSVVKKIPLNAKLGSVIRIDISPDGKTCVIFGDSGQSCLIDLPTLQMRKSLVPGQPVYFFADDKLSAHQVSMGIISIVSEVDQSELYRLVEPPRNHSVGRRKFNPLYQQPKSYRQLRCNSTGITFAAGDEDGIAVWDIETRELLANGDAKMIEGGELIALKDDPGFLVLRSSEGCILSYCTGNNRTIEQRIIAELPNRYFDASNSEGRILIVTGGNGVDVWNINSPKAEREDELREADLANKIDQQHGGMGHRPPQDLAQANRVMERASRDGRWRLRCTKSDEMLRAQEPNQGASGAAELMTKAELIDVNTGKIIGQGSLINVFRGNGHWPIAFEPEDKLLWYFGTRTNANWFRPNERGTLLLRSLKLPSFELEHEISIPYGDEISLEKGQSVLAELPVFVMRFSVSLRSQQAVVQNMDKLYFFSWDDPGQIRLSEQTPPYHVAHARFVLDRLAMEPMMTSPDGERVATVWTVSPGVDPAQKLGQLFVIHLWDSRTGDRVFSWPIPLELMGNINGWGGQTFSFHQDGNKFIAVWPSGTEQVLLDATPITTELELPQN